MIHLFNDVVRPFKNVLLYVLTVAITPPHTVSQISSLTSSIQSFIPDDESGFIRLLHQEHSVGHIVFMRSVNQRNMQDTSGREELIETW
jgi:hypothetical protein